MAGHSKWANIRRRKESVDAKRGKIFTRLLKEVTVAARLGGSDASGNPRLRAAVQEARSNNVPNAHIDKAIKKGTGELEGLTLEEVTLEGYGPGGVAVLVEAVTDNRNRTVAEIRHLFSKHGGSLGESGCVSWMFQQRGLILLPATGVDEESAMELALDLGADDVTLDEDQYEFQTAPDAYSTAVDELETRNIPVTSKQLAMVPQNYVQVEADKSDKVLRLMDVLEDHDDVQNLWANFDLEESAESS